MVFLSTGTSRRKIPPQGAAVQSTPYLAYVPVIKDVLGRIPGGTQIMFEESLLVVEVHRGGARELPVTT